MLPYKSQKCRLTSAYGYRIHPINGWRHFHGGIDLVGVGAREVVAVADGKVVRSRIVTDKSDATWEWGEYIAITGKDGMTIYYCHLSERLVKVGQTVKAGDVIGIEGKTGQATGPHLHFEVRRGSDQTDAAKYLGIKNALGTYNCADAAIDALAKEGIINTPEYWREHKEDLEYLPLLLIRMADYPLRKSGGTPCANVNIALERIAKAGAINTPEYWRNNAEKVKYLPELICKFGGCL